MLYYIAFQLWFSLAVKKVEANKHWLELIGKHQLLVCASDINLPGENINITKKKTQKPYKMPAKKLV
jgi:hypothetical protein